MPGALDVVRQAQSEASESAEVPAAPTLSGPVIGIIYPPPEVRNIVDKTASFVARNGPEFEARIRQNELGNPKFNFLNAGDPYHAYYQHKVKEIREGRGGEPPAAPTKEALSLGSAMGRLAVTPAAAAKQQEILQATVAQEQPPPRDPPPDFEFIADPPSISGLDLDMVKLTAQFVARNGRQFLTDLMNKEQRNYQFDFLRPQHSLFHYFTRLLEQYTKVLLPPKEIAKKLGEEARTGALDKAKERAAWLAFQAKRKAQDEARVEKERLAYASIDWHDFVVVETVDYPMGEQGDFPPPTTPLEVGARVLAQERGDANEPHEDDDTEMQLESDEDSEEEEEEGLSTMEDRTQPRPDDTRVTDMEEDSESDEELMPPPPPEISKPIEPAPLPPRVDRVVVKKYDPKRSNQEKPSAEDEWLVSPITKERIPASKVADHVRIQLLDPRWIESRDRAAAERSDRDAALAPGAAIEASLKQLAERRTDIFGVGDEETAIGKKIGEEEKRDDRVTWDGHTSSVEAATRAARAHITLEEQIHQIHKVKGLLPDEEKEKIGPKPVAAPPHRLPHPRLPPPPPVVGAPPPVILMPQFAPPPGTLAALGPPLVPPPMVIPQPMPIPHPIIEEEPAAKRQRTEDGLIEEGIWLRNHGSNPVSLRIAIPNAPERTEWKLNGRIQAVSLALSASVSELKNQLLRFTDMPVAKQKIQFEGIFLKDSNTLAYYNIPPGATMQLQIKERGGRKK